jgi:hypothetical protein
MTAKTKFICAQTVAILLEEKLFVAETLNFKPLMFSIKGDGFWLRKATPR